MPFLHSEMSSGAYLVFVPGRVGSIPRALNMLSGINFLLVLSTAWRTLEHGRIQTAFPGSTSTPTTAT